MKNLSSYLKTAVFFGLSLIIFLSLFSYTPADISFLFQPSPKVLHNFIGLIGAYLGFALFFLFGYASYFLPFYLFFLGWSALGVVRFFGLGKSKLVNFISFLLFLLFLSAFIGIFAKTPSAMFDLSGAAGFFIAGLFIKYLNFYGSLIVVTFLLAITALLLFGLFLVDLFHMTQRLWTNLQDTIEQWKEEREAASEKPVKSKQKKTLSPIQIKKPQPKQAIKPEIKVYTPSKPDLAKTKRKAALSPLPITQEEAKKKIEALEEPDRVQFDPRTYRFPSIDILKIPEHQDAEGTKENIEANIKDLEKALSNYGVEAKVVSVQKGPVVTMYELQPDAGVKIQKISTLHDDIALAMKAASVRIVAPLAGRGTIGVEIPNDKKLLVSMREVLEEDNFQKAESKLSMAIGKDVSGNPVVANLKEMPHLLIAGATGSGKTVCVNSLISSILFKARPDEVKFIMIDPKMVELACYSGIPHLIHPIISDAKKAFVALSWAVEEMERRYKRLAGAGARNIDGYNKGRKNDRMSFIVIVVDELADLMIVARESVETSIQRLAQLSRAVGIHLVLATQRPSVDVITGIIKANFPARIGFKVATKVDSRTVLDIMGAEKLLGKGDLLFLKPGATKLIRAQGAFIDDEDIDNLTTFIREQGAPVYEKGIETVEKRRKFDVGSDELFDDAVKVVLSANQASASILQRRLRVGYTRAARLLDLMEQAGIVGQFCGSKAREILVDSQQYFAEQNIE
ncbi:MAG: DNA translocase FtsK [Candidatus Omnitrophica bacterium]|nr:DNA translocase FtsK [Candidatus Omnitrophota bacterium]